MLAPRGIPQDYSQWNEANGSPFGHQIYIPRWKRRFMSEENIERLRGPFAVQMNNSIRQFEYPWAFDVAALRPKMRVLEIGGGLAGFQFVLDQFGCQVVNVDPGMAKEGWPCDKNSMAKLNRRFGTQVELRNTTVDNAELTDASFDRVFCISVIEHLPSRDAENIMQQAHRCLKPGGLFVITCDLFLNLTPFSSRRQNEFGVNQDVKSLVNETIWELVVGDRKCIYAFPEFDPDFIMANLETFMVGVYPALAQCLVLRKR